MFADCEDDGLARACHHDSVLEQGGVRVLHLVLLRILVTALLHAHLKAFHVRVELLLVDSHVHLLDQEAISRHAIASIQQDNIADHQILHIYSL